MKRNENKSEGNVIKELEEKLPKILGENFFLKTGNEIGVSKTANGELQPDILVENKLTGEKFFIEVKGSSPNDELPLAIIPSTRRLKQSLENEKGANFILLSLSGVPSLVREALTNEKIQVIEIGRHEKYLTQLKDYLVSPH
ncbi:MAG: hypothetical protein ABI840_07250 [bacterium]